MVFKIWKLFVHRNVYFWSPFPLPLGLQWVLSRGLALPVQTAVLGSEPRASRGTGRSSALSHSRPVFISRSVFCPALFPFSDFSCCVSRSAELLSGAVSLA